jgi:hypothetical protein
MEFKVIEYSEKSIALVGDTKEIKDKLKKLGGRFNSGLSCGAGWVFSKTKQKDLEKLIAKVCKDNIKKETANALLEIAETKAETLPGNVVDFVANKYANAKVKLGTFAKAQTLLASLKKDKKAEQIIYGAMMMFLLANPNASEEELLTNMYNKLGGN